MYAKELTDNPKLGPVSATYVAQATCPSSCPFLRAGCYAENGFLSMVTTKRLNRGVRPEFTRLDIAILEAAAIDRLSGQRHLRLHVVGDSGTVAGTELLAEASARYMARAGRRVWTYTHAWREVSRASWGIISVLASCETKQQVAEARRRGYATAIVVTEHRSERLYEVEGIRILPCPEQTRGVTCADCRLCLDDQRLRMEGITIGFAVHGSPPSKNKALRALNSAGNVAPTDVRESAAWNAVGRWIAHPDVDAATVRIPEVPVLPSAA